jgi:hypothetical protein
MAATDVNIEPKLAPPGAGLPKIELFIARLIFTLQRWRGNRDSFNARFQLERARIHALVNPCDAESGTRRVLIKRVPGLEDSSRYWSVAMTLDHLRIIHNAITRTIEALAAGMVPKGTASTAWVKPNPQATMEVTSDYEQSCDQLLAAVAAVRDLKTSAQYAHPWFGPLDAAGWHALAASHIKIHRVQIERIRQGL